LQLIKLQKVLARLFSGRPWRLYLRHKLVYNLGGSLVVESGFAYSVRQQALCRGVHMLLHPSLGKTAERCVGDPRRECRCCVSRCQPSSFGVPKSCSAGIFFLPDVLEIDNTTGRSMFQVTSEISCRWVTMSYNAITLLWAPCIYYASGQKPPGSKYTHGRRYMYFGMAVISLRSRRITRSLRKSTADPLHVNCRAGVTLSPPV